MIDSDENDATVTVLGAPVHGRHNLPYRIELWNLQRQGVERLLARAANVTLARAIFIAAQNEYLGRYVVLRRGSQVVAESQ